MNVEKNNGETFYSRYNALCDEAEESDPVDRTKLQEALVWLEKAGELNYPPALRMLAISYKCGGDFGVDVDFAKAVKYAVSYEAVGGHFDLDSDDLLLVPDKRGIDDDQIDWYECVEKIHPTPALEFALAKFYWDLPDSRPPINGEERRALTLYEKAAASGNPDAEYCLAMYLINMKDVSRAQEAANYLYDVTQNRDVDDETVNDARDGLLRLYATKDSGCFDIERAFDVALEMFDGYDEDSDRHAALELYWHMNLPPHNDMNRFGEKWNRKKHLFEDATFSPDELLLESARSVMDEIDTRITGRWWQVELAAGNPQAIKAMDSAKKYLRVMKMS